MRTTHTPHYLRRDYGPLTPHELRKVKRILADFMATVRKLHARGLRDLRRESPQKYSACDTCALNPKTDTLPGFAGTAYGLIHAFCNGKLFACHANQPDWKKHRINMTTLRPCMGFLVLVGADGFAASRAAWSAHDAIRKALGREVKPRRRRKGD